MTADDDPRSTWVLWLLVVGAVTLAGLAYGAEDQAMQVAYVIGGVVDVVVLVAMRLQAIRVQQAIGVMLAVGLLLGVSVLVDVAVSPELTEAQASYLLFRAAVLVSGIAFLALGPRPGSAVALGYVLGVVLVLVASGTPATGTDHAPGTFEVACLLVAVVTIFRVLSVRVRSLEHTARRATAQAALAFRDELTGLPNRRQMTRLLAATMAEPSARNGDAAVLFDLDHFKAVNDSLGHKVGDEVLQRTAALANAALRDADHVARWGGEEFLALLRGVDLDTAVQVADRMRRAMADVDGPTGVTASFGVTAITADEEVDDVVVRADEALYAAKRAGRNQIWVSEADSTLRHAAGDRPATGGTGERNGAWQPR